MKKLLLFFSLLLFFGTSFVYGSFDYEKDRLQWHLDRTEKVLRKVDTSNLSSEQAANRTNMLNVLQEYTKAGKFPNNDKFPGKSVPFFRGSNGNLCAVGYLMYTDPQYKNYVENIVKTNNNIQVMDIKNDKVFNSWLQKYGFTQLEAAMIQPGYAHRNPPPILETLFIRFVILLDVFTLFYFIGLSIFGRKYIKDKLLKYAFIFGYSSIILIFILLLQDLSLLDYMGLLIFVIFFSLFFIGIWKQRKELSIYLKGLVITFLIFILCRLIIIFLYS